MVLDDNLESSLRNLLRFVFSHDYDQLSRHHANAALLEASKTNSKHTSLSKKKDQAHLHLHDKLFCALAIASTTGTSTALAVAHLLGHILTTGSSSYCLSLWIPQTSLQIAAVTSCSFSTYSTTSSTPQPLIMNTYSRYKVNHSCLKCM